MHTIVVASNLGIVRTGLIQLVHEHVNNCTIVEASSVGEVAEVLKADNFNLLMADFSYINNEEEDMRWAAILKKQFPAIPILLFLGENAGNSILHMISDSLICIGRGATVTDLRNCLDFFLVKGDKPVLRENTHTLYTESPRRLQCC